MDPGGQARVFFVMGRQDAPDRDDNVNARYIVEQADISGVPEGELTQALRDDLRGLVGKRLDSGEADRLQERIERELPALRRVAPNPARERGRPHPARVRGAQEGAAAWLRFEPLRSNVLFHSEQGWGSFLDLGIGDRELRFTPIVAIDNADDLVEEYSGYGLRFETRKLGTPPARRQPRVVLVRSGLARRHAGRARARARDSSRRTRRDRRSPRC